MKVMMIVMTILMMMKMTVNVGFVNDKSIRRLVDIFQPVSFESPLVNKECSSVRTVWISFSTHGVKRK